MRLSFSHLLLITCIVATVSCKTNFIPRSSHSQNIPVAEEVQGVDSQIIYMYKPFKDSLEKDMKRVISISEKEMIKGRPESLLTNFLADLLLAEAKTEAAKIADGVHPVISYFNYGGIRTSLPKGEITVGKIFELMPFENELVFIQLTGTQVQEFLNHLAEKNGESVGGVRYVISNGKAVDVQIAGNEIVSNKTYWLATNDYVAEGGDGLEVFTHRLKIVKPGLKIRDVILHNLEKSYKEGKTLTAKEDGRVKNE